MVTPMVEWLFISFIAVFSGSSMAMSSADKQNSGLHNKSSAEGSVPYITELAATYCNFHWKLPE